MSLRRQIHFSSDMGRMGNQLFQYACALQLSRSFGYTVSLSHLDKMKYFRLNPWTRFANRVKGVLFFRVWTKIFGLEVLNNEARCLIEDQSAALQHISKPTQVWGFFQSPRYFDRCFNEVKRQFRIKDQYTKDLKAFKSLHNLTETPYLAVHLRLTDYKGFQIPYLDGDDKTLPLSYYHEALAVMSEKWNGPIVFVSDDPDTVDKLFPEIPNKILSRNNEITDFMILRDASAIILSNSTFAWWAAFLGNSPDDRKICPRYFLGYKEKKEVPLNIYPDTWIQIEK